MFLLLRVTALLGGGVLQACTCGAAERPPQQLAQSPLTSAADPPILKKQLLPMEEEEEEEEEEKIWEIGCRQASGGGVRGGRGEGWSTAPLISHTQCWRKWGSRTRYYVTWAEWAGFKAGKLLESLCVFMSSGQCHAAAVHVTTSITLSSQMCTEETQRQMN